MADLGEEAYSSQMKVIATFLRLLECVISSKISAMAPKRKGAVSFVE